MGKTPYREYKYNTYKNLLKTIFKMKADGSNHCIDVAFPRTGMLQYSSYQIYSDPRKMFKGMGTFQPLSRWTWSMHTGKLHKTEQQEGFPSNWMCEGFTNSPLCYHFVQDVPITCSTFQCVMKWSGRDVENLKLKLKKLKSPIGSAQSTSSASQWISSMVGG